MLPTKFRVNWHFGSGGKAKKYFQNSRHGGHIGFPIVTNLAIFYLKITPMLPTEFQVNRLFSSGQKTKKKKKKEEFQGDHSGHLGFPIRTILAFFDLQVTRILLTEFQVNWPFGSGEKAKIDFQDGGHVTAILDFRSKRF